MFVKITITIARNGLHMQVSVRERYDAMQIALNRTGKAIAFSMCEWGVSNPWLYGSEVQKTAGHKCLQAHLGFLHNLSLSEGGST